MTTQVVNKARREPYDEYIGRGSIFGNPFSHSHGTKATWVVKDRDAAVDSHLAWVVTQPQIMRALPRLRNKRIGCFCHPLRCHGDNYVLLLALYSDEELAAWGDGSDSKLKSLSLFTKER